VGTSINSSAEKSAAITPSFVALFRDINPHIAQKVALAAMISLDFSITYELIEAP